jgi:hypothetical protein
MGKTSGPFHCLNCNRDGHFQASCKNPPFCYNCKKDGHRAMTCPKKKGLNLKICGFGLPDQAFYSIHVPEEEESKLPITFLSIKTVREGMATSELTDRELKHLFKGKSGWNIKPLGKQEFMIYFPSEVLRYDLTKFRGFEFATAAIKAKVVLADKVKEAVSMLEAWVKASGFPHMAKHAAVIKEISYLIEDPIEVDEKLLKKGSVKVKVHCRDSLKNRRKYSDTHQQGGAHDRMEG